MLHKGCADCQLLWERYYSSALEEYFWQDRLETANVLSDARLAAKMQADAEPAFMKAAAVRQNLAAHLEWHAGSHTSVTDSPRPPEEGPPWKGGE